MKKFFVLFGALYSVCSVLGFAQISPVVQVVSYSEPLGLYFSFQGWGSGSIIDQQGHIITNNHVVDDGMGGVSDNFGICITDDPTKPPRCHYTASVIDRNPEADIAILRIDETDIFGKKVDFGSFSVLPIDTQYVPQSGDQVIARGYPWVGANTLTETQGIVAGTARYNSNTYIKTDTLIAGGNSGGPLIRDGKMIGVNTFLIGGGYDPSLGYSLLISQVSDFIKDTISEETTLQSSSEGFPVFLQKIDTFAVQKKIIDPLVIFTLKDAYHIDSYIPSMTLEASLSEGGTNAVSSFGFYHMKTPKISDIKELKNYIFSQFSLGEDEGFDLQPVSIGGKTFYEIIDRENPDNNILKSDYGYISMIDETHMLILFLSTPNPTKNTLESIQKSIKTFLENISFPAKTIFPNVENIVIPQSDIELIVRKNSSISYNSSEYQGILSYHIKDQKDFVMVRDYLGNFWSRAQVAIFRNSFETQNNSLDAWIKNTVEAMYKKPLVKKKVAYKGHEGFLTCFPNSLRDEFQKRRDIIMCESVFFIGDMNEYIVSIQMILDEKQFKRIDKLMVQYIMRALQVPEIGDTIFAAQDVREGIPYSDVGDQTQAYQEALKTMISLGILQNRPLFEGDTPLLWREYLNLYIWAVYHKKMTDTVDPSDPTSTTLATIVSKLPIVLDDYAEYDEWQIESINNLLRLLIAGGSLPRYDAQTIFDFSNASYESEGIYKDAWDMILDFESEYFSQKESLLPAQYASKKVITYNPFTGLDVQSRDTGSETDFFRNNSKNKQEADQSLRCDMNAAMYFSRECRELRKTTLISYLSYSVLTKGKAIEIIIDNIDASLWGNISPTQ